MKNRKYVYLVNNFQAMTMYENILYQLLY